MIVFVTAAAGVVGGFIWQKRRDRRRQNSGEAPVTEYEVQQEANSPGHVVVAGTRRAFITSVILIRTAVLHAFRRTALHYAPVPLTFGAAVFSALPAILGTTFSINFAAINGVSLIADMFRSRRDGTGFDDGRGSSDVVRILCSGSGILGFIFFQRKWEKSPLRGSLSVFGKDPHLDRCASAERYLVEKLALVAYAGYRKVASLRQLMASNTSDAPAGPASRPLANYARQIVRGSGTILAADSVFGEYADRYVATHEDMRAVANKLKYPDTIARIEPALTTASDTLLAPLRTRQGAQDIALKLEELRKELGSQFHCGAVVLLLNIAAGGFLGVELAQLPWIRRL